MTQAHKALTEEVLKLPTEKLGKVLSFVRFTLSEQEDELCLESSELTELLTIHQADDFTSNTDMLAQIMELPND